MGEKKSILYVCDHSMGLVGGSQESLKVVMEGIKERYNISLFTPGDFMYKDEAIKHDHFSKYDSMKTMIKHPIEFIKYYITLARNIRKYRYNIIHTQEQIGYFAVSFMKRIHIIDRGILLVHTERGLREKYSFFINQIFDFSLKYTNVLITTTSYNQKAWKTVLRKKYPRRKIRCELVENTAGKRFEIFEPEKKKKSDKLRIGFAGRYCSWKGWGLVKEICKKLAGISDIEVYIVLGCLTDSDQTKGEKLFFEIQKILQDRFIGAFNFDIVQMDDFYYNIDLFLLTSDPHTESFGRVLVEAMSRKTAILGTDCGGATEVMGSRERICNTADEFVIKIKNYLKNRELLSAEQENCYVRYMENYSVANNVSKHLKIYQQICTN